MLLSLSWMNPLILLAVVAMLYLIFGKKFNPLMTLFDSAENFEDQKSAEIKEMQLGYDPNLDPYEDYDNINKELSKPVVPGRKDIDNLIQMPTSGLFNKIDNQANLHPPKDIPSKFIRSLHKWSKRDCLGPNHPLYKVVQEKSPYMYPDESVMEYYGKLYYHDWKYPLRPIDVGFAANPAKYCKRNPQVYPCYDWWKRHDLR